MKNKFYFFFVLLLLNLLFFQKVYSSEQFNFDVTEIEILKEGNLIKGLKGGTVSTDNGIIIKAEEFIYDKVLNELEAIGNVNIIDKNKNYKIFSDKTIYKKSDELIISEGASKAELENIIIKGEIFEYYKLKNIFNAKKNVIIFDKINEVEILSEDITYNQNKETFFSKGPTESKIQSKYNLDSSDVVFLRNEMVIKSSEKTNLYDDKNNYYKLSKFDYDINDKSLKGENIIVTTNFNLPKSDKYYFKSGFFNFNNKEFLAKDTKILLHSDLFGISENNPRIKGVSSSSKNGVTKINKAVFTSCKINDDKCPPWSISAKEIAHDKNKKQLIYKDAVLKVYDLPVVYFPKFFHPDPSVERQSGFLTPQINSSNVLGDSIYIPYFHAISKNRDITFKPTIFDSSMQMFQNEYRQQNDNSSFIADFSLTRGYKSSLSNKRNSISHLFAKFKSDLKLENFIKSDLFISVQKVSNDTYLKVFDTNLLENEMKPGDQNSLTSELKLSLDADDFNFTSGMQIFENLSLENSDRFQYILPYYDYNKNFDFDFFNGQLNFTSSGSNDLNNTNVLKTRVINDLGYQGNQIISDLGIVNNLNVYFKNLATLGKNDTAYKSSPQLELMNIYELSSSLPLTKSTENHSKTLVPKMSLRFNPSDMKNYSTSNKSITVDNIFNINRLGLTDSFEKGKSLTIGIDYKKENLKDINKFFEFKLASSFRDKEENFIPSSTGLNKKNSNLFGSAKSVLNENISIDYDFRIDNNYDKFEYNSINTEFSYNNFTTKFNFVEENGETGNENFLENLTSLNFDENNFFSFKTRRNRKLNLTEFYDLVYEYKNDCLIAAFKYNKTYYSDRDLKPKEDLLFSVTFFPLTKYEHDLDIGELK
tara:strand:+ start:386 stop:3013 length:2628 start_codon:yes stop_codon:yes gene_type:complete